MAAPWQNRVRLERLVRQTASPLPTTVRRFSWLVLACGVVTGFTLAHISRPAPAPVVAEPSGETDKCKRLFDLPPLDAVDLEPRLTHAEWVYLQQHPDPAMPPAASHPPVTPIEPPSENC